MKHRDGARVVVRRPLATEIRQEEHTARCDRHIIDIVQQHLLRRTEDRGQPGETMRCREVNGHLVPATGQCMTERMHATSRVWCVSIAGHKRHTRCAK